MTIYHRETGAVLEIVLDRDERMNALDIGHLRGIDAGLDHAAARGDLRAVLLRAEGRAFWVGADIKAMVDMNDDDFAEATQLYQSIARKSRALPHAIIAAVHGYALGGGFEATEAIIQESGILNQ